MGTNENKNVKDINENVLQTDGTENIVNEENTGGTANDVKFDMQATQRITFLNELREDKDAIIQKQQGNVAPNYDATEYKKAANEKELNEPINIQNSSSEKSAEPIAQAEIPSAINNSENEVQKNPDQISQEINIEITRNQNNNDVPAEVGNKSAQTTSNGDVDKEKQHVQDKKDYRLERMLFDRINKMQGKIKESLELIKKFERINAKEENLPNIVTTLHDKLTHEVIKQFRTVGIEFNMKSYLVQAIVSDLLCKFEDGISEFKDCSENLNFVREVQEDFESKVELAPTSRVKNFFARLRGMFKPERKQEKLEQLERERQEKKLEEANIHLIKYKFINSELERYTIKKNIVNSLTREILHGQGSGLTLNVNEFINQKIAPEMKMLGLEGLIPDLNEKIYQEYKEKDAKITKEDFENTSIGDLRKNIKMQRGDIVRTKLSNVVTNSVPENDDERMVV